MIDTTEILIRPAVSVIVCAFTEDRWDDICRVIGSLRTQTEAPGEIILVIDHCPPLLRRARQTFRDVTVVPNHFQKGLAGGRNTGVEHAWGDVVAFVDDDAVAEPDWLTRLADHYLDPAVLGVGGFVEPAWEHGRPGWFPPELDWVVGCSYQGMRAELGPVRNFIGANMSFRRETLAEIGGFAVELGRVDANPVGCEETELCLRVSQRYPDAVLLYEPAAAVSHRVRKQRARWRYLRSRCYAEGRSKAIVAGLAGAGSALASERSYVRSAIPRGVLRSLWKALRGRPSGLLAAFALVMAVLTTGFGYGVGRMSGRKKPAGHQDRRPGGGAEAPDAGRQTLNGHGTALAAGYDTRIAMPQAPAAGPEAPPAVRPEAAPTEPTGVKPVVPGLARSRASPAPPPGPATPPEVPPAPPPEPAAPPEVPPAAPAQGLAAPPQAPVAEPEAGKTAAEAPPPEAPPPEAPREVAALEILARLATPTAPAKPGTPAKDPGTPGFPWWEQPPASAEPSRTARRTITLPAAARAADRLLPWAVLVAVAALWVYALGRVRLGVLPTAGFGLVSALPATFWAASALLIVSFGWTVVRWPGRWPVLGAHLVTLVAILHATPALAYGTLRYSWAWKHVGVIDYIIHHGIDFNLGGVLGVYQGWPGFFALNAFLTSDGGLHSALSYASWALAVNDLLWLGPVLLIARAFTADWRMIWAAAWVFELGNWVGQDYFSPQALTYFLFLTVVAICLRWLGDDRPRNRWVRAALMRAARWVRGHAPRWAQARLPARRGGGQSPAQQAQPRTPARRLGRRALPRWARRPQRWEQAAEGSLWYRAAGHARPEQPEVTLPPEGAGTSRSARLVLVLALVPLMVAISSSHQLTPLMVVAALSMLAVFRHLRPRVLLPLVAAVIAVGWIFYGGLPWLQANSGQVFSGFGALWANSSAHIVGGGQVTPDQVIVEWGARLLSAAIGLLAMAGFLRYRRHRGKADRRSWNRVALLGVASIAMVAGNSYGGEIIFRAFLFALPFMAVAAAALFFPRPRPRRYLAGAALTVTTAVLAAGFFVSNFGTEAMNYFTPQEVTAAQWLYRTAPAGAQVIAVNSNFPWAFVHYNQYSYTFLDGSGYTRDTLRNPVQEISFLMSPPYPRASYLVFTRSQAAQEAISGPWSPNDFSRVYDALMQSSAFKAVYLSSGVTILQLAHSSHGHAASPGTHPALPHTRKARPPRNRARLRALRARYYARHHPARIGGRPVAP